MRRTALILATVALACAGCQKKADDKAKAYTDDVTDVALIKPMAAAPAPPAEAPACRLSGGRTRRRRCRSVRRRRRARHRRPRGRRPAAAGLQLHLRPRPAARPRQRGAPQARDRLHERGLQGLPGRLDLLRRGPARRRRRQAGDPRRPGLAAALPRRLGGRSERGRQQVVNSGVTSEDLSRQIVDTDAQLRAKTTLRDRLQGLLATHPGKVGDLLAVERELARVQGDIDSAQSELADMRGRVAMSDVTLNYGSSDVLGGRVQSPLASAFHRLLRPRGQQPGDPDQRHRPPAALGPGARRWPGCSAIA